MPITGKFVADFENFKAGADDAVARLKKIESGANAVDVAAKKMTAPTGGTSGLTQMSQGLGQVDRILSVLGLNIGASVGALSELGAVAGTTGTALAAVGPAAAVVGTALSAWKVGGWIGDVTGLTKGIESLTGSLLRLPAAADAAGRAQADVFRRYSQMTGTITNDLAVAQAAINQHEAQRVQYAKDFAVAAEEIDGVYIHQRQTLAGISGEIREGAKYLLQQGADAKKVADYYGLTAGRIAAINRDLVTQNKLLKEQTDEFQQRQSQITSAQAQRQGGAIERTQATLGDYSLPAQIDKLRALDEQLRTTNLAAVKALENEQFWQEELVKDEFERTALEAKHAEDRMRLLQEYGQQHVAILEQIRQKQREQMTESTALFVDALTKINELQKAAFERRGLVGEGAEAGQVQRVKTPQEEFDKRVKEAASAADLLLKQTQNAVAAQQLYDAMVKDATDRFVIASGGFIQKFNETGAVVGVFGKSVQDTISQLEIISGEKGEGPLVGVFGRTPESVYNPRPPGITKPWSLPGFSLSGPSPSTTVNMNISGILDPRTIDELTRAVSQKLMFNSGRQFGQG